MASDDFSGVSVALDKASYQQGETMTLTVSGQNRHTSDGSTTHEMMTIETMVRSTSGVTYTLSNGPVDIVRTVPGDVTLENVTIVSVTDSGGRSWTVAPGGLTATAVA